jgi:hypothetical protein
VKEVIACLDALLVLGEGAAWTVDRRKLPAFEAALVERGDDPHLLEIILYVSGVCHRLSGEQRSPEAAAEIMSALGRVKAKLPVLDRCESFLEKLRETDERRGAVFANSGPKRAPYLGTPAASGTVKAGVLGHRETRRLR